jgi:hypothetical protein
MYVLPVVFGCATTQQYVKRQEAREQREEQHIQSQFECMTAEGHFNVVAGYVHQQIDQHPTRYMNELYDGAEVALKHAPNGVYSLALRLYQEDMLEDFDSMIYGLQEMRDKGFSYTYDLNYDE